MQKSGPGFFWIRQLCWTATSGTPTQLRSARGKPPREGEKNVAGQGEIGGGGQDKRRRAGWKRKDKIRAHCYQMWKQSLQWQWFWPPTWTSRPGFPLINTRKNKLKFESSYSSSGSQETLSTSVRRFILQQNANKTVPHLIAGSDTENGDWYCVQLWKDLMRQRCMRVGPVHACVRVCYVRKGTTGPETTTIHPNPTWTVMSAHTP